MSDTQTWGIGWRACSSDSSGSPLAGRPSGRHRWWDWGSWYSGLCLRSGCRADSLPRRRSPVWTIWATPAPGSLLFQVYILQRAKQVSWSFWITNPKYDPDKRLIFFFFNVSEDFTWISLSRLGQLVFSSRGQLLVRDGAPGFLLQLRVFIQHHVLEVWLQSHKEAHTALLTQRQENIQITNKPRIVKRRWQFIINEVVVFFRYNGLCIFGGLLFYRAAEGMTGKGGGRGDDMQQTLSEGGSKHPATAYQVLYSSTKWTIEHPKL